MKTYEAMFLMEPSLVTDLPAAEAEINRILERAQAKVIGLNSWGERKLAYPIRHRKRGLYILSYFESAPDKITGIERDVQLSEKAVRVLVLRREGMTAEAVQKALSAEPPAKVAAREEYGFRPRSDRPDDRDGRDGPPRPPRRVEPAAEAAPIEPPADLTAGETYDPDAVDGREPGEI